MLLKAFDLIREVNYLVESIHFGNLKLTKLRTPSRQIHPHLRSTLGQKWRIKKNPSIYLPKIPMKELSSKSVNINLDQPMDKICKILSSLKIKTRVI